MLTVNSCTRPDHFNVSSVVGDQAGAPIAGAQVSRYASPTLLAETTTGPTGEFTFSDLKTSRGVLRVRATGFSDAEREWTTIDNNPPPMRITLTPLPLRELVVVTAARTATRLAETSASVAVVSAEDRKSVV